MLIRVSTPAAFRRATVCCIQGVWFCKFIYPLGKCIANSLILQIQNICSSNCSPARQKDPNWNTGRPAATLALQLHLWVTHYLSIFETAYLHLTPYKPIKSNSSSGFLSHFFRDLLFKIFFLNRTSGFRDWAKKAYLTLLIMKKFVP